MNKYSPKHFRKLPEDFDYKFSRMPTSPFILIKANGDISYGGQSKDHIVDDYNEKAGDILLFSWAGNWKTDVFLITEDDLKKHYE